MVVVAVAVVHYCFGFLEVLVIMTVAPSDREYDDYLGDDHDNEEDGMER